MRSVTVATIASPLQAMSLVEAVIAGAVEQPDTVIVDGPRLQIDAVLALADPRLRRAAAGRFSRRQHLALLRTAREIVLGDPFSRMAHVVVLSRTRGRIVVLEDGAAVLGAWRTLSTDGAALVRAHGRRRVPRQLGRLATRRLRQLADRSEVALVAGLPMSAEIADRLQARSFDVIHHDFEWCRTVPLPADQRLPTAVGTAHVVLGSALAADGHLDRKCYRDWLTTHLGPGTMFLPHRRDQAGEIELARQCGAKIVQSDRLTAELLLRDVEGELVIDSFPMTAALTIPAIRREAPTTLRLTRLPARCWEPTTPASMIALIDEIAELAGSADQARKTGHRSPSTSTVVVT